MSVTVTLRYEGKEYTFVDGWDYQPWLHSDGTVARTAFEAAEYMYTEGNYGCDCNRSLFLSRHCGVDFKNAENGEKFEDGGDMDADDVEWSLNCGRVIELVALDDVKYFYDESIGCEERVEYKRSAPAPIVYEQRSSGLYVPQVEV